MTDEVRPLLGAYHDGELGASDVERVEAHLTRCAECQRELEMLRRLSSILAEAAVPAATVGPERFVAQVGLRLPPRREVPTLPSLARLAWWSVPVLLLLGWASLQAIALTCTLVLVALRLGLGGDALAAALPGNGGGTTVPPPQRQGLGPLARAALADLSWVLPLAALAATGVGAIAYWSWLASLKAVAEQVRR